MIAPTGGTMAAGGDQAGCALDYVGQAGVAAGAALQDGPVSAVQHCAERFGDDVNVCRFVQCATDVLK
jgi:hypothetical protein